MKTKLLLLLNLTILFSYPSFSQDFYIPVLNIGIADGYEPFQFLNPETGKITGLDADIIGIILKELEIEAVYFQGEFDDVLAQYKFGKSLNLLTGVEITENRKLFTDFTQPIYYRHSALFVLEDSSFTSVTDLNNHIIAGDRDSFIENTIKKDYSTSKLRIIHTDTKKDSIVMLQEGTVQAIIMPKIVALSLSKKLNIKIKPILEDIDGVPVAIAVKKDSAQLKDILNNEISILKSNGTIDLLIKKWTE